jgi:lysozyme family protein
VKKIFELLAGLARLCSRLRPRSAATASPPRAPAARADGGKMADFETALVTTLTLEGVEFTALGAPIAGRTGYGNHPNDPGKETNYGVTIANARACGYDGPMIDLPFPFVRKFYRDEFWDPARLGDFPDQAVADEVFDTAVNCGRATAILILQGVLNGLNNQGQRWEDIAEDGASGPATINALRRCLSYGAKYRLVLLRLLNCEQGHKYLGICRRREKSEAFMFGWALNRVKVASE